MFSVRNIKYRDFVKSRKHWRVSDAFQLYSTFEIRLKSKKIPKSINMIYTYLDENKIHLIVLKYGHGIYLPNGHKYKDLQSAEKALFEFWKNSSAYKRAAHKELKLEVYTNGISAIKQRLEIIKTEMLDKYISQFRKIKVGNDSESNYEDKFRMMNRRLIDDLFSEITPES